MQIAIDGPASAGKSTVAKIIAKKLGFIYVDTGAMYRAATYLAMKNNVNFSDQKALVALLEQNPISFKNDNGEQLTLVSGQDISKEIRLPEISANVSEVSAQEDVRTFLVDLQRKIAGSENVVMDGRDIGTTVLPDAQLKVFLIASAYARAKRRYLEFQEKGIKSDSLEQIQKDIEQRDYLDSHREISPLTKADNAIELDTTELNIDQVVEKIISLYNDAIKD